MSIKIMNPNPKAQSLKVSNKYTQEDPSFLQELVNLRHGCQSTDLLIICRSGKRVAAHQIMVQFCSPFLKQLFLEHAHCSQVVVQMPHQSQSTVEYLMEFLYSGMVLVPSMTEYDKLNQLCRDWQYDFPDKDLRLIMMEKSDLNVGLPERFGNGRCWVCGGDLNSFGGCPNHWGWKGSALEEVVPVLPIKKGKESRFQTSLKCPSCFTGVNGVQELRAHLSGEHYLEFIACELDASDKCPENCGFRGSLTSLIRHYGSVHQKVDVFLSEEESAVLKCPTANNSKTGQRSLVRVLSCYICERKMGSRSALISHLVIHFKSEICSRFGLVSKVTTKCPMCSKNFGNFRHLINHLGVKHGKIRDFVDHRVYQEITFRN
ncbi:hypothetical protein TCAL_05481 [Tigriopus californicus]|uniref:BTB domain-containing protein n=2 Tax=Tigriopus californicus TaxID=6832 RepID=A0A553P694_TIGCA|nr:hypothetical protein TCAL_05481 [Tigriopus californicus]|eukprot:TCALIF_05481-PA protein Name:"Similar to ken2 Transcription factor Ken 2 (Culex quinquefasciatus)" AED:0.31 eAED:0.31 QI:73/1/0/1/1/0.5/2/0/374